MDGMNRQASISAPYLLMSMTFEPSLISGTLPAINDQGILALQGNDSDTQFSGLEMIPVSDDLPVEISKRR